MENTPPPVGLGLITTRLLLLLGDSGCFWVILSDSGWFWAMLPGSGCFSLVLGDSGSFRCLTKPIGKTDFENGA